MIFGVPKIKKRYSDFQSPELRFYQHKTVVKQVSGKAPPPGWSNGRSEHQEAT
jgi:hypothetical protein